MGDDFMVKDLNNQDPSSSMLRGMQPYQALTAADEQARQRSLAQDPSALQVLPPCICPLAPLPASTVQPQLSPFVPAANVLSILLPFLHC